MLTKFINGVLFQPPKKPDSWMVNAKTKFNSYKNIPFTEWETDINDEDADLYVKILFCHGNADDLYTLRRCMKRLIEMELKPIVNAKRVKYHIRAWDYPFYGESPKPRSELNSRQIYKDCEIIGDNFFSQPTETEAPVIKISMGYSLGCAPASYYAASPSNEIDILFIIAPFASIFDVSSWSNGLLYLTGTSNDFLTYKLAKSAVIQDIHVVVLQSKSDEVIPFEQNNFTKIKPDAIRIVDDFSHTTFLQNRGLKLISKLIKDAIENYTFEQKIQNKYKNNETIY